MSGFNPNATSWTPSATTASWTPSAGLNQTSTPTPAPNSPAREETSESSDVDESDPLWQVVLKIADGDKEKAKKMVNDPDSLMIYPEVVALLSASDGAKAMEVDFP